MIGLTGTGTGELSESKLTVSCARFYSMQYANCFKPTPFLTDGSTFLGKTTELATPFRN